MTGDSNSEQRKWSDILTALRSPLSFLGLALLVANSITVMAAASMNNIKAFTYSIHMFLAIVGTFVLIALWSPRSLYHPADIHKYQKELEVKEKTPIIFITFLLVLLLFGYIGYQIYKWETENSYLCTKQEKIQKQQAQSEKQDDSKFICVKQ